MGTKLFPFREIYTWYQKHGRHDLPWRHVYTLSEKERLYRVWISEVMLQQTQVERVRIYYQRFLEKFPTIESLAETSYEEVFPYWQGLGYYNRAKNMIRCAQYVVAEYQGIFPHESHLLEDCPGIGSYTSRALQAFGYDKKVLAWDANLGKVFSRYFHGNKLHPLSKTVVHNLEKQIQEEGTGGRTINNALMDFGALVSTSIDKIDRENYPLRDCLWFTTKGSQESSKKKIIRRTEKGAKLVVFLHEGHKRYWSSGTSAYEPFLVEPTAQDDRRTIQDYFAATFDLEVSVRPSFGSGIFAGMPVKLFHAQIQTGKPNWSTFSKQKKDEWLTTHLVSSRGKN